MPVRGQLQALRSLPSSNESRYPPNSLQGGPQSLSGSFREEKNWLPLTFIEQRAVTMMRWKGLHCHDQSRTSTNCWTLSCFGTNQRSWTGNDMLTVDSSQREFTQICGETINVWECAGLTALLQSLQTQKYSKFNTQCVLGNVQLNFSLK